VFGSVQSCLLVGFDVRTVEVQADIAHGEVKFFLVGLAATSVKEARERVRSAIKNSGLEFPGQRLTVNLAPAELPPQGSAPGPGPTRNRRSLAEPRSESSRRPQPRPDTG